MKRLILLSLSFILCNCADGEAEKSEEIPFELTDISLTKKMKMALESDYLAKLGMDSTTTAYLTDYYKSRGYKTRWINDSCINENGIELRKTLQNREKIGLPAKRNKLKKADNFIQEELLITANLAKSIADLNYGIIDYTTKKQKPTSLISVGMLDKITKFEKGDLARQFVQFGPVDSNYRVLADGLIDLFNRYPIDTSTFDIVPFKSDSLHTYSKVEKALFSKGYLKKHTKDSLEITDALRIFQIDNGLKPDGVIGKYTSKCLNESTKHKVQRILVSLDKIRSKKDYPEKYIHINIPEYMLRLYVNDSLKSQHKLVVGSSENQTPELESNLRKIVVYPTWTVPYSIASKEILPAAKRNPGYFERNDYKLFRKGEEVNPYQVNWKRIKENSFPYKVVQQPSKRNSLGVIKFDFHNNQSVYFHDTPSKGLFGTDVRAYSHGCMRTQNPVELGRRILFYDSLPHKKHNPMTPDSLDSLLVLEENYEILLKDRIPIYIEYMSVIRSEEQKMILMYDIYGRDEEYIRIINE